MLQAELFATIASLRKEGRTADGLALLRDALRRDRLDPEGIDKAGRIVRRELLPDDSSHAPLNVLILGQCTTSWIVTSLTAAAWARGIALRVVDGGYDRVLQELTNHRWPGAQSGIVVLLPWNKRLLEGGGDKEQGLQDELRFWQQAWLLATERLHGRMIQVGYDWIIPGPLGQHLAAGSEGPVSLIREMNARLRGHLPQGAYFLDLEQLSGISGRRSFYDMRRYFWTKQPFSENGTSQIADHICAGIRALTTGPKKVLVLDLDNTLWGGVVGEVGPLGIALGDSPEGEAFVAFQTYVKQLAKRGVLLAVASKNNPEDAREPFRLNSDMVLTLDDMAAFEACWEPKHATIARIAASLNLGLDSFVFFDDNPAEREQVRQAIPEVEVVEVPQDPAEYVRALQSGNWFETVGLSGEDGMRGRQYAAERHRREAEATFGSLDDYFRSLEMVAELGSITDADLPRVVQLLGKTNQFNLTTRRHSHNDVIRLRNIPDAIDITLRLRDRFGEHGLVSVLLAVPEICDGRKRVVRIDSWLMSCRVISRGVEQFLFGHFLDRCRQLGYDTILGEYIPTRKNGLVAGLFDELGFEKLPDQGDEVIRFALDVATAVEPKTFVVRAGALI